MGFLAAVAIFVVACVLVSKLAKRRNGKSNRASTDAAIDVWAVSEIARMLAARLEVEESDLQTTIGGNPDPDLVTSLERSVSGVEIVYERAPGATGFVDLRVEIRMDSGAVDRSIKRVPWTELPEAVRDELAKSGGAHVYRPWQFPWQR